jgi:NADPH2 dehydrogenase
MPAQPEPFQSHDGNLPLPRDSKLFKPLKVGNMELQHRVVLAPLTRNRSDKDHTPLDFMAKYYSDRACIPGTLVISEATAISHFEEGQRHIPGLVSDQQVKAWRKVTDAVHAKGSYFFQQIWGLGRAADSTYLAERGFPYRSSSNVPMESEGVKEVPQAMTEEEIQDTIQAFVDTAKRAVAAGADGVEVHSAHGYLLDQFLSDKANTRTDKWGGSIENRARLPLEVIRSVADAIGAERTAFRFSPYAGFQGSEKADAQELYTYLVNELKKMDYKFAYMSLVEATGDPGALVRGDKQINQGKTLDFLLEAWDNTSPVIVAGGYKPQSAVWAAEEHYKKWDVMIAFGRLFLANPDFVYRLKNGIEFNPYNRATFYLVMNEEGYNDYKFSEEYLNEQATI